MAIETATTLASRPEITKVNASFWEAAARHEFILQYCPTCDRYQHEAIDQCPVCFGEFEWREASGRGRIHTFILMHQVYHPVYSGRTPYNVTIVELDEGPLMLTNIVNAENDRIVVGAPVTLVFEDIEEGLSLHKFELA